jgi:hypothetical protein
MRAQLIQLGAPAERVHVIRTGVDLSEITYLPRSYPTICRGLRRCPVCNISRLAAG